MHHTQLARRYARKAVTLAREAGYRYHEGQALTALAAVELATGQTDAAVQYAYQALNIHQEGGHRLNQAQTHVILGHALNPSNAGREHWQRALAEYNEMGVPDPEHLPVPLQPPRNKR